MNKQIEELTKDIVRIAGLDVFWKAEELIKQGYQKVDKDKQIVLSREEYEILLSNADNAFQDGLNESRELYKQEVETEIRKETAREILNKVKLSLEDCSMFENVDLEQLEFDGATIKEILNELAKQFGVDLGEEQWKKQNINTS